MAQEQPGRQQPITLTEPTELFPLAYSTLAEAAREGRIRVRRSGWVWLTTRGTTEEAIAEGRLHPKEDVD